MTIKYIKILKLSADDWLLGYNFSWGLVVSIIGLIYFQKNDGSFEWKYLISGSLSGIFTMIGALFATYALKVDGAPQGSTCAVCNSRIILLVLIDSIVQRTSPPWMQWIGLVLGVCGTLIISIPDELKSCFKCIFRCKE